MRGRRFELKGCKLSGADADRVRIGSAPVASAARPRLWHVLAVAAALTFGGAASAAAPLAGAAPATTSPGREPAATAAPLGDPTTATASDNVESTVARADIFVGQPNILPRQAMPLGNGRLGVAIWAADGLTLQLNRAETLPGRLSPGEVVFDSLEPMTVDRNFRGRLDVFNGEWQQSGAGLAVDVFVDPQLDRVIVDVTGADPNLEQKVSLNLWKPRAPTVLVGASEVSLSEHWIDDTQPGASGLPFGSLAGVRVLARDVASRKVDDRSVATTFHAMPDGHYRVIIASPSFTGRQDPTTLLQKTLDPPVDPGVAHHWWNEFWRRVCLIKATSRDGRAAYLESLRTLFLFYSAAQNRGALPGSQAGIADLFSSVRDAHYWDPASFWEWNLRMQVAANLSAGVPELNEPYFALYRNNLDAIRRWTLAKMGGRAGICVPETMRFNGVGVEYEAQGLRPLPIVTHSCDQSWTAVANARTLSTGAEVGLWVWETYLSTGDIQFLRANYPLMAEAARFLLAYQRPGADGLLHTSPSNAHETQSDVLDPTTDIAAIRSLFPATMAAAQTLSRDAELRASLAAALEKTPPLPLIDAPADANTPAAANMPASPAAPTVSRTPGGKIIAPSYTPSAPLLNSENIGLEPVWPYSLITPDGPLFETALRTYEQRPFRNLETWSHDPIDAARLGLGAEMADSLDAITQSYQIYPNGMADLSGNSGEFYIEQMGIVSAALSEALVQDNGNTIRLGPAIPPDWSVDGTVYVRGNARIAVTAVEGKVTNFQLMARATHSFRIANPWESGAVITVNAKAGKTYAFHAPAVTPVAPVQPTGAKAAKRDTPPAAAATPDNQHNAGIKTLGRAMIGLPVTCCATPADYNPTSDRYPTPPTAPLKPESH